MRLLIPLGLLGLLGIIALIIIYIIKPNYQQRLISSTFIWRLSLKYKKRKIPLSRLRNILLIACQVLTIVAISAILAKTVFVIQEQIEQPEAILIIDSSASMRTEDNNISRFERAIEQACAQAEDVLDSNGLLSVILAGSDNVFLTERASVESKDSTLDLLRNLYSGNMQCSYASSDLQSAVSLTDRILSINPSAKIYVYTDKDYSHLSDNIELVNVAEKSEWNASILSATPRFEDNYYTFQLELACYGRDIDLPVYFEIFGANAESSEDTSAGNIKLECNIACASDQVTTLLFKYVPPEELAEFESNLPEGTILYCLSEDERVYSYQSVHISLDVEDSLPSDNNFDIYGGLKELIKIQYYSRGIDPSSGKEVGPNLFFQEVFAALKRAYAGKWDIQITEVKKGNPYETQGFDFYIFEHSAPDILPADGIVLIADPSSTPTGAGFTAEKYIDYNKNSVFLEDSNPHPILNNITPTNISVSRYTKVSYTEDYTELLGLNGDPLLLIRNDDQMKVAVLCFSLHYSNLPLLIDFPLMIYNMFEYFLPATTDGVSFETDEKIILNSRSDALHLTGYQTDLTFNTFPHELTLSVPGSYTISQTTFTGKEITDRIYITMPREESNISALGDALDSPYYVIDESDYFDDLLLYLAAALVTLLMAEWYLQHKESQI